MDNLIEQNLNSDRSGLCSDGSNSADNMIKQNLNSERSSVYSDGSDIHDDVIGQNLNSDRSSAYSDESDSDDDTNSESNEEALNINSFPEEMLIKIFSYLSHNELGLIARVCQKWNMLTKNPMLWKKVTANFWSLDHQIQTAECFINLLPPCVTYLTLKFNEYFTGPEPLSFEPFSMKLKKACPHLQMLKLCNIKLSDTLPSIINLCTQLLKNVRILLFHMCKFPKHPARDESVDISKIEILELFWCKLGHFNKPQFSRMPHLKCLRFVLTSVDDSWFVDDPSFFNQLHILDLGNTDIGSRVFQAIWNHAFNLKELYLCCIRFLDDKDLNLKNPVFSNLETICLSNSRAVTWHDVVSLIRSCQSLQKVYVNEDMMKRFYDSSYVVGSICISEILKKNSRVHFHIT